ncbi:AGE family epimerase/isomerase [Rhizosaccharibacter radicis]|uniref:AGE family epimerase/isomerase n=1 Tax=Rhizosaccharibacter radicis TaxID=2782605 RepID=A0ABT1W0F4_9PROT|nr:AGE family epimerase/isomerase [Acetobacteraceae bacterium KSS12]
MPVPSLDGAAERIRRWFDAECWPFWSARAAAPNGLFLEQVRPDGEPDPHARLRVRVQARQIFSLSRAVAMGHDAAREPLARGLDAFDRFCRAPDGRAGWIAVLEPDGRPADTLRDCYDQAFCLLGFGAAHAVGLGAAGALARATMRFLENELADRAGGFREDDRNTLPRRANPHMHLLEAFLFWFEQTGDLVWRDRANAMAALFAERFFHAPSGTVGEFFDGALRPAAGEAGLVVEPGHLFEWSWLLHRLAAAGGRDLRGEAGLLHRWGLRHGLDAAGWAMDEVRQDGTPARRSRRLWPQTELIKSLLVNDAPEHAALVAQRLFDSYLRTTPGLWIDRFDAAGVADTPVVPASTLYHLVRAFEEVLRVAEE